MSGERLLVPLNRAKFQKFRNMNAATAGLGLFMVIFALACGVLWIHLHGNAFGIFLYVWLVVFIGLATVPAWQLACIQTKTLTQRLPALVIDQEGIQDNASNYLFGRILWTEIESISMSDRYAPNIKKTFKGVAITVKDKKTLLRKKPKLVALWMQQDQEISNQRQVFIPQGRLEISVEEIVQCANELRQRAVPSSTY